MSNYYKVDRKIAICLSFVALFLLTPLYRTDDFDDESKDVNVERTVVKIVK